MGIMVLNERELLRYDRQIRIAGFGVEGQIKLKRSKVLVAGLGGLGAPAAIYLAAAGIGKLLVIDKERVELSNLNRQIIHWTEDVNKTKVKSALEKLCKINPEIEIEGIVDEINELNVYELVKKVDVVVDGMDNFKTRFLLNEACVKLGKPFIHAAVYGLEGRLMTIFPGKGPCLRCLIPIEPEEVKPFPVLGPTPAIMASMQVMEVIKVITGLGEPLVGKLLVFDGTSMDFMKVTIERLPNCSVCSGH
ncbi:MAG: HesA/MoeB/ThiF family protein [Nitrososphaeria archaeon]|nr:HesA/MoeB/ThiF family protein [Nitrososphaeria archaeon]